LVAPGNSGGIEYNKLLFALLKESGCVAVIIIRMKTISAAERKRQIRERRRFKQNQTSSSLPTETANAEGVIRRNDAVTGGVENNNNLSNQNVECSILPNSHKVAHNNNISGAVGETKECQSTSSKTTLFSVVMSRSNNKDSPSEENNNSDTIISNKNIATTPKATTSNTRQDDHREKQLFSPTKSPGGYDVLKALDVANVYNEHLLKIENNESGSNQSENDDIEPEDDWMDAYVISRQTRLSSDDVTTSSQSSSVKENLLDGMEAEIIEETRHMIDHSDLKRRIGRPLVYDEPIGVGVVDWSLKKRLRIESVPGRCLPGNMSSSQLFAKLGQNAHKQSLNDGYVHQLAIQYLSKPLNHRREGSTAECLEARWKASTMYYQHPSAYPLPPSILQDLPKAVQNMTQCDNGDLSSFIRGPRSIYHRLRLSGCGSLGGLGESASQNGEKTKANDGSMVSYISDTSKLLEQRRCEWREAFRSVFNSWRTRLRQLEGRRNSNDSTSSGRLSSLDEKCELPTTDEVLRCSFYSIRPEQVVLFRCGYIPVNVNGNVEHCIMPIIVFSSTTVQLRSMLSSMGIKMRVLREMDSKKENGIDFFSEENLKDIDAQVQANAVSGDTESVHAELEAIKWAENGNGNVTVAQKNKRRRLDDKTFTSPLYCVGYNDCSALFELFLNTCGLSVSSGSSPFEDRFDSEIQSDVPLLLCRSLGSCMHFTLKTLCVSGLRDYGYMNQMKSSREKEKQETTDVRTTMELRGPILPCSLRDITCSLVDRMMIDKLQTRSVSKQPFESSTAEDGVGTHHFAMFVQPHEGERATLGPKSTGISSSSLFNGTKILLGRNEPSKWHECSHRELLNVMVWDSQRPDHVSYNSKHLPFSAR